MTFLKAAEVILKRQKRPMKPQEIYELAEKDELISSSGKTPEMSMKARISTEIKKNGFSSKFMRVGPNKFALRSFELKEYIAKPFKISMPNEIITCISREKLKDIEHIFGYCNNSELIEKILTEENLSFIDRKKAETDSSFKQLISYVCLTNKDSLVLTYRRGAFTNAHEMLRGSACLGFGGHVQDIDSTDMFTKGYAGVFETAKREIFEELRGRPKNLELVGFINDDSSPEGVKHLGIVLKGELPEDFRLQNLGGEIAINDLKYMSIGQLWERYYDFEFWSQLLIKEFFKSEVNINKVFIKPSKFNLSSNVIIFVGEIAAGKTILSELLTNKLGFKSVSTRKCVSRLINVKDFGVKDRKVFQEKAQAFIESKDGPSKLANEIANEIKDPEKTYIIDGIRHFETLKELRKFFPELILIYVDSTRDDAFRNFKSRSKDTANIHQFRESRHHPVESEITLIKGDADAYVFNGGTKEDLYSEFINWFINNKK